MEEPLLVDDDDDDVEVGVCTQTLNPDCSSESYPSARESNENDRPSSRTARDDVDDARKQSDPDEATGEDDDEAFVRTFSSRLKILSTK